MIAKLSLEYNLVPLLGISPQALMQYTCMLTGPQRSKSYLNKHICKATAAEDGRRAEVGCKPHQYSGHLRGIRKSINPGELSCSVAAQPGKNCAQVVCLEEPELWVKCFLTNKHPRVCDTHVFRVDIGYK